MQSILNHNTLRKAVRSSVLAPTTTSHASVKIVARLEAQLVKWHSLLASFVSDVLDLPGKFGISGSGVVVILSQNSCTTVTSHPGYNCPCMSLETTPGAVLITDLKNTENM